MVLARRLFAEYLATLLLLAAVIGSGVMGERLGGGNAAVVLLANTLATMAALYVLVDLFGPLSGAHMNPLVSAVLALRGEFDAALLMPYVGAQLAGAACGAWLVHAMFGLPFLQWSQHAREGAGQWLGEIVATAGLLLVVLRAPRARIAALLAAWIGAAYWFTASTSFANPAATFGRMLSDSFSGIAPRSVPSFLAAQIVGAVLGSALHHVLGPTADIAVPLPRLREPPRV